MSLKVRVVFLLVAGLVVSLAMVFLVLRDDGPADPFAEMSPEEILAMAHDFYESRPYYERPRPYSEVPEGLPDLRAETCGACHAAIYAEWRISTHARAWKDDAQFMEELHKVSGEYDEHHPDDVGWMCVNCHTPMVNQLERLVVGLENGEIGKPIYADNPFFDREMQDDAISCATCHVANGMVYGPRGDSPLAPHPVAWGEHLVTEENCVSCHQAQAHFPEQNLACFFTTGEEWAASPAAAQGQLCQDCHMPRVTRKSAELFDVPEREVRHHWFGGSLIPKHPDFEDEIAPLRPLFGSGATLEVLADPDQERGRWALEIRNDMAGHNFPTGDPERHVDVRVEIRTPDGELLGEENLRIGSIYEWWPEIRLVSDNRILAGEALHMPLSWPEEEAEVELIVHAEKFRMYQEAFDYHNLEGRYVRGRVFHESRWSIDREGTLRLIRIEDDFGERTTLAPEGAEH